MLSKRMASQLREAAPFKFAPQEGPAFFERNGWKPIEVQSLLKNAARLKRFVVCPALIRTASRK